MFDDELLKKINADIDNKKIMHSPAQLAYAGDAIYELLVRSHIINNHEYSVNQMHKQAIKFVKAKAQAELVKKLNPILTEEEIKIIKRGRNAKVTSSPKNANLMDYRYATGFETLFGYLYLNNEFERLMMLFNKIVNIIEKKDEKDENN